MVAIRIRDGIPFVAAVLTIRGQELLLENVLLDTGCSVSVFRSSDFIELGDPLESSDLIQFMIGVGGREAVIPKQVEGIKVGDMSVGEFGVQVGAVDYGFLMDGILGMDFLIATGAVINLHTLMLERSAMSPQV